MSHLSDPTLGSDAVVLTPIRLCSSLPSQEELDEAASSSLNEDKFEPTVNCVMDSSEMNKLLTASKQQIKNAAMDDESGSFGLMWDSGASCCLSNDKEDFVGKIKPAPFVKKLSGLARGLWVKGVGKVAWTVLDVHGNPRNDKLPIEQHSFVCQLGLF